MKRLGVTDWRNQLGQLRQGTEPTIVMYWRRPAALMVPIPPAYWSDCAPFVDQVLALRDKHLRPPHAERPHPWTSLQTAPIEMTLEEGRRGSAQLFGLLATNTPIVLTFYDYAGALMLPLPPEMDADQIEALGERVRKLLGPGAPPLDGWIK